MPRPNEVAILKINGQNYEDWTSVLVQVENFSYFPKFQVELTEFDETPSARLTRTLKIVPGDLVEVTLAGYLVATGFVIERHAALDGNNHAVRVVGAGSSHLTTKSSVWTQSGSFDNKSIEQFTREMLKPTGVGLKLIGNVDPTPFENIHVQPGEIIASAIDRYAKMRKTIVGSTEFGELALIGDHSATVADYLIEGENILSVNCAIRDENVYNRYIALGQQFGNDQHHGDKANKQVAEQNGAGKPGMVHVEPAPIADSQHGIDQLAKMTKIMLEGTKIEAHVTVQGWLRENFELYRAGAYYWVQSPSMALNQLLGCKAITYQQDASGTKTTLIMVDPAHMNGSYAPLQQPPLINPSMAPLGPL